jgi:hypothetical protein
MNTTTTSQNFFSNTSRRMATVYNSCAGVYVIFGKLNRGCRVPRSKNADVTFASIADANEAAQRWVNEGK